MLVIFAKNEDSEKFAPLLLAILAPKIQQCSFPLASSKNVSLSHNGKRQAFEIDARSRDALPWHEKQSKVQ